MTFKFFVSTKFVTSRKQLISAMNFPHQNKMPHGGINPGNILLNNLSDNHANLNIILFNLGSVNYEKFTYEVITTLL